MLIELASLLQALLLSPLSSTMDPVEAPYAWQKMDSAELPANALSAGKGSDDVFLAIGDVDGKVCLGVVEGGSRYLVTKRHTDEATLVTTEDFSVLTVDPGADITWEAYKPGHVGLHAVGVPADGNLLYVGRATLNGVTTLGLFLPGRGYIYAIHGGTVHKISEDLEVLSVSSKF